MRLNRLGPFTFEVQKYAKIKHTTGLGFIPEIGTELLWVEMDAKEEDLERVNLIAFKYNLEDPANVEKLPRWQELFMTAKEPQ